jgi:DNA polymerase-3 subunit chi
VTRIDFYVLPDLRLDARERFAARLATRAFREGHRSLVLVEDDAGAGRFDNLLWREPRNAFVPHVRLGSEDAARVPVTFGTAEDVRACEATGRVIHDLLINLGASIPERFAAFDRVAEIVCQDEAIRAAGRDNYRYYRERGYPLHHHDLGAGQSS